MTNSKDAEYVKRIENLNDQIDRIMADAKEECMDLRIDIRSVLKDAKADGVNIKAMKAVIRARKIRAKLGSSEQDQFDLIRHALGDLADTPLGQSAMPQAGSFEG